MSNDSLFWAKLFGKRLPNAVPGLGRRGPPRVALQSPGKTHKSRKRRAASKRARIARRQNRR